MSSRLHPRSLASPGSSPRSRLQNEDQTSPRSTTAASTSSSLPRRDSKLPTLDRKSPGSGLPVSKTRRGNDGGTASSTPRSGTLPNYNLRRSSSTVKGGKTATRKVVARSRIPRLTLDRSRLPTYITPATSISTASSPRRTDRSRQSSPSLSPAPRPRRATQRKTTPDMIVPRKSQQFAVTADKNEPPRDDQCPSAEPSPREKQEQSPADLIVQAFARSPLRSKRSSPASKSSVTALQSGLRSKPTENADTAEAQAEARQQPHQTDVELRSLLPLPVGDTSPRQPAASTVQQQDRSEKIRSPRRTSPSLSPAPKVRSSTTNNKRLPIRKTTPTPTPSSEAVEVSSTSRQISDETVYPASPLVPDPAGIVSPTADETAASSSPYSLQSPKNSKSSSMSKTPGPPSRQKHQDANQLTISTRTKKLPATGTSSPRYLSTGSGSGSTPDERQDDRQLSTDEARTKRRSRSYDVVDVESEAESPRPLTADVDSHATGARRKTQSSVTRSKETGAGGTSTSPTELRNDESVTIADVVDKLRRRLDVNDTQIASLLHDKGQPANNVDLASNVPGDWPTPAAAADDDASRVVTDTEDILVESFPLRVRKSRRQIKSHGQSTPRYKDRTWKSESAAPLEEYYDELNDDVTGQSNSPQRDQTLKQDGATAGPPRTPERDLTWTEDTGTMLAEVIPLRRKVAVVDPGRFKPGTPGSSSNSRKLETPLRDAKPESRRHRSPRHGSVEDDDETQEARLPQRRKTSSNLVATTNKPPPERTRSPARRHTSRRSPSPPSAAWNSEPRSVDASPVMSDSDGDDDFQLVEDLTVDQDAESAARKMHERWMEVVDGYSSLLSRCHSFTSDATMARRLTELRRKTATLVDAQKQFDDIVDPEVIRRIEAMRRRAARLERQVVTAGCEPGRREWMVRRAESELSAVGDVAAAFKEYSDEVATRKIHDSRSNDAATSK